MKPLKLWKHCEQAGIPREHIGSLASSQLLLLSERVNELAEHYSFIGGSSALQSFAQSGKNCFPKIRGAVTVLYTHCLIAPFSVVSPSLCFTSQSQHTPGCMPPDSDVTETIRCCRLNNCKLGIITIFFYFSFHKDKLEQLVNVRLILCQGCITICS